MNFDLHLYGETPEELLNVLAHLGHMDSNYRTPIPDERHPAQAPAPQPQSTPAQQPDKSKAQTPRQAEKGRTEARSSPCGGACKPYNGRSLGFSLAGGCRIGDLNLRAKIRTRF